MDKTVQYSSPSEYNGSVPAFTNYTMSTTAAAAVPPVSIPPLTPLSSHPELPINGSGEYFDQVRRKSLPYASDSSASSSYTSPPGYSDHSPSTSNATLNSAAPAVVRRTSTDRNAAATEYDLYSPLNGLPESESVVIPPLLPPSVQWPDNDFDDWDALPDLLRQDRKADYTPRRPMNIYFIYMRVRRPELALHNPNLSTGDLSKLLGKEWNSMTPDQKAPWNELAERLMRAFKKKFPDYQYERGGGKKQLKKRPRSLVLAPPPNTMLGARRASQPYHVRMVTDPHSPVWDPSQNAYIYKDYGHYQPTPQTAPPNMYAHPMPSPMSTPIGAPLSSPVYPGSGWPTHAMEVPHHPYATPMEQPQMAAYPFPAAYPSQQPGEQMGQYYAAPPMYTPPTEAPSPWDEYMVQ